MSLVRSIPPAVSGLDGSPILPAAPDKASATGLRSYRILVVDDMPSIHQDMRKVLSGVRSESTVALFERKIFGTGSEPEASEVRFEIDSAFQASEAIERVRQAIQSGQPYAVAFVDMRMPPGEDGLQTIVGIWQI